MYNLNNLILSPFFSLLIVFVFTSASSRADQKQDLEIIIADSCAIEVKSDPFDNCKAKYGSDRGACGRDKECICTSKNKFVSWTANEDKKFEIRFPGDSPFTNSCQLKSKNNGKIKCKVNNKGDFHYDVYVEGCPSKPYDPRIVVN